MGYFDPAGYVYDGSIYCEECIGDLRNAEDTWVIFEHDESDTPQHCSDCTAFIPGELTRDGYRDLEEHIRSFKFEYWEDLLEEYVHHWGNHDWHVIPTFAGRMDPFGNFKERW